MKKYFSIVLILLIPLLALKGQEVLTGLHENPVIIKAQSKKQVQMMHKTEKSSKLEIPKPLTLPFFEDFKQEDIYPDASRWMNNYVYINKDFAIFPPTWGAATFDAVDDFGKIYSEANSLQFIADQLSSMPIRLDSVFGPAPAALSPADSVYLSFYYQPQGVGNDPQPQDSLVLDFGFYSGDFIFDRIDSIAVPVGIYGVDTIFPGDTLVTPCDPNWGTRILDTLYAEDIVMLPCDSIFIPEVQWKRQWSSKGMTLDSFRMFFCDTIFHYDTLVIFNDTIYDTTFVDFFNQVNISIKDSAWFRNDFQFRFYNYASIASENLQSWQSNCDYWNVDYILLDKNRSRFDSTYKDVTFTGRAPSFLKDFQSMPFYQYSDDPVGSIKLGLKMYVSNLDNGNQTAQYTYVVINDVGGFEFGWDGGSGDLEPFNQSGFTTINSFAYPPVNGVFPPFGNRDSIYFDIHHYLAGDPVLGLGDTLSFRQKFYNYYAYDDDTPEFGYGLTPAGSQLAYRFNLNRRDTLRAVRMYFNKTLTGANEQFFNLTVWNDLNGKPGDIIYQQEREKPVFPDSLYRFHDYYLDSALPVQGTFYVGWVQLTPHNLNVGFDANNDASANIFYNVTGNDWMRTNYSGALMIRPVLGKKLIEDQPVVTKSSMDFFRVAPNPSYDGKVSLKFLSYPGHSPVAEVVTIADNVLQEMDILVYNLMGQHVFSGNYQTTINLSHLNKGIYIMRIIDKVNNTAMSQKFLITE